MLNQRHHLYWWSPYVSRKRQPQIANVFQPEKFSHSQFVGGVVEFEGGDILQRSLLQDRGENIFSQLELELENERFKIEQLRNEVSRAKTAYTALQGHLEESRILKENNDPVAYFIAKSRVPQGESGSSTKMLVVLAGTVGGMVATGGVFVYSWWTTEEETE